MADIHTDRYFVHFDAMIFHQEGFNATMTSAVIAQYACPGQEQFVSKLTLFRNFLIYSDLVQGQTCIATSNFHPKINLDGFHL